MANLFPEDSALVEEEQVITADVPFGRSWRFDYKLGDFVLTPTGKVAQAAGADAWLEWCKKALNTERYRYLAYSRMHGQEFDDLIGSALSRPALESEIQRLVTETLLVDPRTAGVGNFSFSWEDDRCVFSCTVTNVRDESGPITGSVVNS